MKKERASLFFVLLHFDDLQMRSHLPSDTRGAPSLTKTTILSGEVCLQQRQ